MVDKRFIGNCRISGEMCTEELEKWFSFRQCKFIHNIDTFYYSVKFSNDFRQHTRDEHVLRLRRYFRFKYDGLGDYDEDGEVYMKEIDRRLLLRPVTFSRFYSVCLSYPEYFDIFLAPVVPKSIGGGLPYDSFYYGVG